MDKKSKFKKSEKLDQAREELKSLEDLPLVGGFVKGLSKFIDLAEKVEKAGGEIKKERETRRPTPKGEMRGIYGFSIRTGLGEKSKFQTFGNIKSVKKEAGRREVKVTETREPIYDVFDEQDHILIVAEIPGASSEDVELSLTGDNILNIKAFAGERRFAKEIKLPAKVAMESKQVSYKNGLLEIKLSKKH